MIKILLCKGIWRFYFVNIYAWIGVVGIIVFSLIPLLRKSTRTKENIYQFIKYLLVISLFLLLVLFFKIPLLIAFIIMFILFILTDKKTYTKKRLIIYGAIIMVFTFLFFKFFKANPDHILKHLAKHPKTTSLYIALNGEEQLNYQANTPRPLASVVKTIIALEYAYQIHEDESLKNVQVPLEDLERYYIKNTDGGAHEAWLEDLKEQNRIEDQTVTLHDIAKGMITFSSNANTDYLIDFFKVDNINKRIDQLNLTDHDPVYPVVGALLFNQKYKDKTDGDHWMNELYRMTDETYKQEAIEISDELKQQTIDLSKGIDLKIKEQRLWSDRLPKAPAKTYGQLLHQIATEQFSPDISETIKELMEWPMEMVPENKNLYKAVGAKGGSTAFVLNQAMYVETLNNDLYEVVILIDDLSLWKSFILSRHLNAFIIEIVNNETFLEKVKSTLQ